MPPIIVTTSPSYVHLLTDFEKLVRKFWGEIEFTVDVAHDGEKFADQLLRILSKVSSKYLILLKEDFYLLEPVNNDYFDSSVKFAMDLRVDRMSLQCVGDGYAEATRMPNTPFFKMPAEHLYLGSLEASLWKRNVLHYHLRKGEGNQESELGISRRMRNQSHVIIPEKKILTYADAMRAGERRIRFTDNEMEILSQGPDGENYWRKTGIML